MTTSAKIIVCDGDQTGQELLLESLRVMNDELLGVSLEFEHYDLSLDNRRATKNDVVREAAAAMVETGLGLKAATVTGGSVIVRTGRRIPGVAPVIATNKPIIVIRMAVGDAYGADEGREGTADAFDEVAWRTERIERSTCRFVSEYAFRAAAQVGGIVYGGPKWTVSPTYEGMLKEEMDAAAARYADVPYRPTLIDATYAGLLTDAHDETLVIPALNRDGDCLSDLVLAMFGSIAGAESVLLALDEDLQPKVAMAEAPHGTAPTLEGKNVANPMAMLLAQAALLDQAALHLKDPRYKAAGDRLRSATLQGAADGVRTFDLGGEATTSGVVDDVIARLSV